MTRPDVLGELEARGLVQHVTEPEELRKLLMGETIHFYAGYDPTASSMHAGNLVPLRVMAALARAGHKMIAVVGGATGMIGDPSGRSSERNLLDEQTLANNLAALRAQVQRFVSADAVIVNNRDWFGMSYLDFLRDVGKHVTINQMLAKESVRARIESEAGISYTEFSYMLLQAYDYARLAMDHGCRLQVGGSDQWGNILTGIDLGRKLGYPKPMYGLVAPLLLTATGEKFGKSTGGGRVWLDPAQTSPYHFYQFWMSSSDADVEKYLKMFSFRALAEIERIVAEHRAAPEKRVAQKALAHDVTEWVHGPDEAQGAIRATEALFGGSAAAPSDLPAADLPTTEIPAAELEAGVSLVDLLVRTKLAKSKTAARTLIEQGGAYANNERINDVGFVVRLAAGSAVLLRAGKKAYHVVRAV